MRLEIAEIDSAANGTPLWLRRTWPSERTPASVGVRLNKGDGSFAVRRIYPARRGATALTAADLDRDGDLDLAVANQWANSISILRNRGGGDFEPAVNYSAGAAPLAIAAGDLDGDQDLDLWVANWGEDTVSLKENTGDAIFNGERSVRWFVGNAPSDVKPFDLDEDGKLDMIVTRWTDDLVSQYHNKGGWTFENWQNIRTGNEPINLTLADLDGDGDTDLSVANAANTRGKGSISLYQNIGGSVLANVGVLNPGIQTTSVNAVDLDQDGHLDLVATRFGAN